MRLPFLTLTRAVALLAIAVFSSGVQAKTVDAAEFVKKASIAGNFEIESSKLAMEKSQDREIKAFAMRMIDDHKKANDDMAATLQSSHSSLQSEQQLDEKHQKIINMLQAASKEDFNQKYLDAQEKAHKEAVALFSDYSKNGDDAALKEFASNTLPTLQSHLKHVQEVKKKQ